MAFINKWIENKYSQFETIFSKDSNNTLLNKALFKVLFYAVISAIFILVINLILITFTDRGGVFGDFFGGVLNPIFTFLTLVGLIVTIVIQRQELGLARIEYEKTADALSTQAIETTFFNILDLHHKIADNIKLDLEEINKISSAEKAIVEWTAVMAKLSPTVKVFEGRGAFDEVLKFISFKTKSPQEVVGRYKFIQNHNNHILGHYFRNLYQALKVIDGYDDELINKAQKKKYASILRAQLSTKELAVLFINCLEGVSDGGQFKNLLIEYEMLEHLPVKEVENGYSLGGSEVAVANDEMFSEYAQTKEIFHLENRYLSGAFGKNRGVPNSVRPNKQINKDT